MSSFFVVMRATSGTLTQRYDRPFRLNGEWEVALTHLKFQEKPWPVYVFCDLVEYTYVDKNLMQFLDYSNTKSLRNSSPCYLKVIKKRFSSIIVNIRQQPDRDDLTSFARDVTCVLHFRKV